MADPVHARSLAGPTPEKAVLLWCARADWRDDTPERRTTLAGPLDWSELHSQARRHGLAPRLAWWVAARQPDGVPPAEAAILRAVRQEAARRDLHLRAVQRELLRACAEAEVAVLPFKGPLLGFWLDGEAGLRHSTDLDLLVHPLSLPGVQALLAARNYHPKALPRRALLPLAEAVALPDQAAVSTEDPSAEHSQHWLHQDSGLQIDLHHDLGFAHLGMTLAAHHVWDIARQGSCDGAPCRTIPPELWLILLCAHGAKHRWERLRWLADVAALMAVPGLDWDQAIAGARATQSWRALASGLLLVEGLLGAPLPREVRRAAHRSPAVRWLVSWYCRRMLQGREWTSPSRLEYESVTFAIRDDTFRAISLLWGKLTESSPADLAWLPLWLHRLSPALRPLRLLWQYGHGLLGGKQVG